MDSTVELRVGDGEWTVMRKVLRPDPNYLALERRDAAFLGHQRRLFARTVAKELPGAHARELRRRLSETWAGVTSRPPWRPLFRSEDCTHLWAADLPALDPGIHVVHVRTTDMFGAKHSAKRPLRVTPSVLRTQRSN